MGHVWDNIQISISSVLNRKEVEMAKKGVKQQKLFKILSFVKGTIFGKRVDLVNTGYQIWYSWMFISLKWQAWIQKKKTICWRLKESNDSCVWTC